MIIEGYSINELIDEAKHFGKGYSTIIYAPYYHGLKCPKELFFLEIHINEED